MAETEAEAARERDASADAAERATGSAAERATGPAAERATEPATEPAAERDDRRVPRWIPKAIAIWYGAAFVAFAVFLLIRQLRDLILWLIFALFLSFAIEPGANALVRRGWRRGTATALILFGSLLALATMVALMVPLIVAQVQSLVELAPEWLARANVYTERWFSISITGQNVLEFLRNAKADLAGAATRVASVGAFLLGLLFQMLTIALFTFYLVADGPRFRRSICSVLPPRRQLEVLQTWEVAIDKTGGYLYSRLLLAVVNAVISFIALVLLGVPFALPLALWQGFVSQFIPVIGTYIAAAVPLLVALLSDPWSALFFLIFVVVYQQIENYVLSPRITARTMQLHPAIAFGAALAGGSIGGLLGAFMALPIAAVIQATASSYVRRHDVLETELTREAVREEPTAPPARRGMWPFGRRSRSREGADASDA